MCPTCGRPPVDVKYDEKEGVTTLKCDNGHTWYVDDV